MNLVGSVHEAIATVVPPLRGPSNTAYRAHTTLSAFGGNQRIFGTVKKTGTPNAPVFRRVRLHEQVGGRVISETWSDAVTGAWSFDNIAPGTYYITAFDHTTEHNGEIATDLVAEPMTGTP